MTEQKTYSDFDLMIEGTGEETYRARVLDSPAGGAAGSFSLPFSTLELENFLLKVGRPRRGTRRLESPEMETVRQFGQKLFDAVFQDDLRLSLRRSLDEVERRDEGLRIRLWFSDAPELASLPWEFLYSESEDQFLVLSAWTPIVRYLDLTQRIDPLPVDGPLRILVMISNPHDYPTLDVEEEWRRIEDSLRPVIDRGAVTIDRTENATLLELQHKLRKNEYHIFHFLGHGGFDQKSDDGVLVMEDAHNRSRLVTGRDLGTILNDHRSLRLAVLNACEGARASDEDPFSGAAQSLIRKGIPAVVAMQFEITDDAAIAFAQEFYGAIADAYPVDAAVGEARRAIFGLGNDIEWGTPVLYMRGDGRLFDVQAVAAPARTVAAAGAVEEAVEEPVTESVQAEAVEDAERTAPEPVSAGAELEPEKADAVASSAAVSVIAEPPTETPEVIEELAETAPPVAAAGGPDVPPATAPSSLSQKLAALPMWIKVAVASAGAVVVVLLTVSIFAGGDATDTTTEAGPTTSVATDTTSTTTSGSTTSSAAIRVEAIVGEQVAAEDLVGDYGAPVLAVNFADPDQPCGTCEYSDGIIYDAPPDPTEFQNTPTCSSTDYASVEFLDLGRIDIRRTDHDEVFWTHRWGNVEYEFEISPGEYLVVLRFTELDLSTRPDQRLFTVAVQGMESELIDINGRVGLDVALDLGWQVEIGAGQKLNVRLLPGDADCPALHAMVVFEDLAD